MNDTRSKVTKWWREVDIQDDLWDPFQLSEVWMTLPEYLNYFVSYYGKNIQSKMDDFKARDLLLVVSEWKQYGKSKSILPVAADLKSIGMTRQDLWETLRNWEQLLLNRKYSIERFSLSSSKTEWKWLNEREQEWMWIWVGSEVRMIWEELGEENHSQQHCMEKSISRKK